MKTIWRDLESSDEEDEVESDSFDHIERDQGSGNVDTDYPFEIRIWISMAYV